MAIDFAKLAAQVKKERAEQPNAPLPVVGSNPASSSIVAPSVDTQTSTTMNDKLGLLVGGAKQIAAPVVASQTPVIAPSSSVPPVANLASPVTAGVDAILGDLGMPNESAPPGAAIEYPGLVDLVTKINSLDAAITTKHPAMESLLQTIHRNLQADPELIHILKPEQIAILFKGLQQKTQTMIVTEAVKSASSGKGRGLKNIGMEDL